MENEIKLVNNVDGSVVSDKMTEYLGDKVGELNQAAVRIGQLEGELNVANQNLKQAFVDADRRIEEATERVYVTIEAKDPTIVKDRWGDIMKNPSTLTQIKVDKANLNDLADAGVKAQALKDVKVAEDKAEEAKKKQEKAEKSAKQDTELAQKMVKDSDKSRKEAIEKAVEKAERSNLSEIAEQKLTVKALTQEADLLADENNNLCKERDLTIEVLVNQITLKDKLIDILQGDYVNNYKMIKDRVQGWFYNRKIKRLNA